MKTYLNLLLIAICIYAATGGNFRRKKQLGNPGLGGTGVSFAFPGLNLFGGGLGNNNGNIFGGATFTRTIVSTVSTVTTPSFRTCTAPVAALMPCVGRRKREADVIMASYNYDNEIFMDHNNNAVNNLAIEPSASIALIIGTTTITDPLAVSEYLVAHNPSSQSIIYPQDISISQIENIQALQKQAENQQDTNLYPSNDSPNLQQEDIDVLTTPQYNHEDVALFDDPTTEAALNDEEVTEPQNTTPRLDQNDYAEGSEDKGRRGLGVTTTVTTVIRVTSVATTLASGAMATLTVMYMGCLPPSLPVSGIAC